MAVVQDSDSNGDLLYAGKGGEPIGVQIPLTTQFTDEDMGRWDLCMKGDLLPVHSVTPTPFNGRLAIATQRQRQAVLDKQNDERLRQIAAGAKATSIPLPCRVICFASLPKANWQGTELLHVGPLLVKLLSSKPVFNRWFKQVQALETTRKGAILYAILQLSAEPVAVVLKVAKVLDLWFEQLKVIDEATAGAGYEAILQLDELSKQAVLKVTKVFDLWFKQLKAVESITQGGAYDAIMQMGVQARRVALFSHDVFQYYLMSATARQLSLFSNGCGSSKQDYLVEAVTKCIALTYNEASCSQAAAILPMLGLAFNKALAIPSDYPTSLQHLLGVTAAEMYSDSQALPAIAAEAAGAEVAIETNPNSILLTCVQRALQKLHQRRVCSIFVQVVAQDPIDNRRGNYKRGENRGGTRSEWAELVAGALLEGYDTVPSMASHLLRIFPEGVDRDQTKWFSFPASERSRLLDKLRRIQNTWVQHGLIEHFTPMGPDGPIYDNHHHFVVVGQDTTVDGFMARWAAAGLSKATPSKRQKTKA
jgi:hypothetical protein